MSVGERTDVWVGRFSDYANPILVKEVRQALKSRQFVTTFMLLLTAAWIITVFGLALGGDSIEYGSTGRTFFYWFYLVLAVAILLIVPFGAYRSLLSERDHNTYELLSITTLSPRQIVWGKLFSALVQLFIFYSAITPFIAFCSLLQGFDAPSAAYYLVMSMLASLMLSMLALTFGTLAKQRLAQGFMTLVVLFGLVIALSSVLSMVWTMIMFETLSFTDPDFWWGNGFLLLGAATYFVLLQQITTAQLTFESDNRSTGIRLTTSAQFFLLWGALIGFVLLYPSSYDDDMIYFFASVSAIHWAVFGLFFSTEENLLSYRVRRDLPKNPLRRLLYAPFLPGGSRGYVFVLLHVAALWLFVLFCLSVFSTATAARGPGGLIWELLPLQGNLGSRQFEFTTALCCYLVIFTGIGTAFARWGRRISHDINAGHVRVLTFLLLMGGIIFPYIPKALQIVTWRDYHIVDITNPFATLAEIEAGRSMHGVATVLLLTMAVLAVLVNLRAMQRGLADVVARDHGAE